MIYSTPNRITAINSDIILKDLLELIQKGEDELILDFSNTSYISSAALRSMLIASKSLKSKQLPPMRLINVSDSVYETLKLTGMKKLLNCEH